MRYALSAQDEQSSNHNHTNKHQYSSSAEVAREQERKTSRHSREGGGAKGTDKTRQRTPLPQHGAVVVLGFELQPTIAGCTTWWDQTQRMGQRGKGECENRDAPHDTLQQLCSHALLHREARGGGHRLDHLAALLVQLLHNGQVSGQHDVASHQTTQGLLDASGWVGGGGAPKLSSLRFFLQAIHRTLRSSVDERQRG